MKPLGKVGGYLKENLGAPFMIAFMMMLVMCADLLALGNELLANEIAMNLLQNS